MDFKQVTLADRAMVEAHTAGWPFENCEPTFANMFLWRTPWGMQLCQQGDVLYMALFPQNDQGMMMAQPFCLPGADPVAAAYTAMDELARRQRPQVLHGVCDSYKQAVEQRTDAFVFEENRDGEEYIYSVQDLINLPGRKYHGKRNHLNQFELENPAIYHPLEPQNFADCLAFFEQWAADRPDSFTIQAERHAITQAFEHFDTLQLFGGWLEINGQMAAFTVAGMINPQLAVIHFEKADTRYAGIYVAINNLFLKHALSDVPFVNRQEDMGLEGLRRAKMSYHPVRFARKYTMRLR